MWLPDDEKLADVTGAFSWMTCCAFDSRWLRITFWLVVTTMRRDASALMHTSCTISPHARVDKRRRSKPCCSICVL